MILNVLQVFDTTFCTISPPFSLDIYMIFRMTSRILNSNLRRMVVLTSSRTQFFGGTKVNITFVNRAQKEFQVKAREGDTVLDTVLDNMIEYDGEH